MVAGLVFCKVGQKKNALIYKMEKVLLKFPASAFSILKQICLGLFIATSIVLSQDFLITSRTQAKLKMH